MASAIDEGPCSALGGLAQNRKADPRGNWFTLLYLMGTLPCMSIFSIPFVPHSSHRRAECLVEYVSTALLALQSPISSIYGTAHDRTMRVPCRCEQSETVLLHSSR